MSDLQAIADRFEIEALRGEFTVAVMMIHPQGALRMPNIPVDLAGREEICAWGEREPALVDYLVQTTHPGVIRLDGDTTWGRAYLQEFGRTRDGRSELNYAIYHDRYQRTDDGWSSPSASTRSDTTTAHRWRARARRRTQPGRALTRRPGTSLRRKEHGDHGCTAFFPTPGIWVRCPRASASACSLRQAGSPPAAPPQPETNLRQIQCTGIRRRTGESAMIRIGATRAPQRDARRTRTPSENSSTYVLQPCFRCARLFGGLNGS
jgi:hypothetical protein